MVETVLGTEALKERNRIYEVFSETFGIWRPHGLLLILVDLSLYHLGLSLDHLLHLISFLNFLFHLVFQNKNPIKQVLSYEYICLLHTSEGFCTESHVGNNASYDLYQILLCSSPRMFPNKPRTKWHRLQKSNVLISVQNTKTKKHVSGRVQELCFSWEAVSILQQSGFTKKIHWNIFNGKSNTNQHEKSWILIENLKPLGKSS